MTTSRIARLAASVHRPLVPDVRTTNDDPTTRAGASGRSMSRPGRPVSRSFDTGGEIAVHAVVDRSATGTDAVRQEVDGGAGWTMLPVADQPVAGQPVAPLGPGPTAGGSAGGPAGGDLGSIGSVGSVGTVPSAGQAGAAPAATDGDLDAMQMSAPAPSPTAQADLDGWTVTEQPVLDDEAAFAQDINAILAHARSVAAPQRRMPLPEVPQAPPTPLPAAPQNGIGVAAGHDVFEQMAAANTPDRFDQGPVSLSVDFARLDEAMAASPAGSSATPAPPAAEAAPAPTPAASAPAPSSPPPTSQAPPATEVPAAAPAATPAPAPAPAPGAFKVTTDVPLVPQQPGLSTHAAACASMVAWRDEVTPDPAAVAAGTGYWERYAAGRTAVVPEVLDVFGLELAAVGAAPTAERLGEMIDAHGPLLACGSPPGEHAVVISGVTSDGVQAVVDVVDPWASGMTTYAAPNPGSSGPRPYAELVASLGAGPDHHLLLAHLRKVSS